MDETLYFSDIELGKELSHGTYGKIFAIDDWKYALKIITRYTSQGLNEITEINFYKTVSHPNILKLIDLKFGMFNDDPTVGLIFPMAKYDLHIASKDRDNISFVTSWMYQLLSAVNYLHQHNYCHNDIKPTNILVMEDNSVVLSDLGLMRRSFINVNNELCQTIMSPQLFYRTRRNSKMTDRQWNSYWDDPAVRLMLKQSSSMIEDDIWALGYTLYDILQQFYKCSRYIQSNCPRWYLYYINKRINGIDYFSVNGMPEKYAEVLLKLMDPSAENRNFDLLELLKLPVFNEYPDGGYDSYIQGEIKNRFDLPEIGNFNLPIASTISKFNSGVGFNMNITFSDESIEYKPYIATQFIDLCYRCNSYIKKNYPLSFSLCYDVLYILVLKTLRFDDFYVNNERFEDFIDIEKNIVEYLDGCIIRDNYADLYPKNCHKFIQWVDIHSKTYQGLIPHI